ncbi:TIGR03087 family PEP-CTERM/XrtA system glycosyltransferase [Tsuneonella sp. HG249]
MTGEVLFIAHRMPFPPDRGDKIRSHHLLKAIASLAPVHVATLGETPADFAAEPMLAEVAASHCLLPRPALLPSALRAMAGGRPVSLQAFDSPPLKAWIARTLAERPIETVFVFSGQMGQYIPPGFHGRVVVDLCDVDSAKFDAYARQRSAPRAWIDAREGRLLAAEEACLARRADATLLVSEAEADLLRTRIGLQSNVMAVGNGIDAAHFDPATVTPPEALTCEAGPHLVFTGQMDYLPNVAAVRRAASAIMPAVRSIFPAAQFHIVGRAPTADVRALGGLHGTRVWGEVADVRPFLAAADAILAPLEIARGVQNKVLEAMAMARPVILSPEAATGIGGESGIHYAVAASDEGLAGAAIGLLADRPRALAMGSAARRFVVANKSWTAALAPIACLLSPTERRRDAA